MSKHEEKETVTVFKTAAMGPSECSPYKTIAFPPDWVNIGSTEYPFWVDAANVTHKHFDPKA